MCMCVCVCVCARARVCVGSVYVSYPELLSPCQSPICVWLSSRLIVLMTHGWPHRISNWQKRRRTIATTESQIPDRVANRVALNKGFSDTRGNQGKKGMSQKDHPYKPVFQIFIQECFGGGDDKSYHCRTQDAPIARLPYNMWCVGGMSVSA